MIFIAAIILVIAFIERYKRKQLQFEVQRLSNWHAARMEISKERYDERIQLEKEIRQTLKTRYWAISIRDYK